MKLRRLAGAAAGVLLLTAAAAACSDDESVFNADVGECIENLDDLGTTVSDLPEVECTDDHEAEYLALFEHEGDDDDFDVTRINEEAEEACADEFEDYVGVAQDETRIQVVPITPTEDSWKDRNDRESICVGFIPDTSGDIETVDESFEGNGEDFPIENASEGSGEGDDSLEEFADLVESCEGGDLGDCDELSIDTPVGSEAEEVAETCGGREDDLPSDFVPGTCDATLGDG